MDTRLSKREKAEINRRFGNNALYNVLHDVAARIKYCDATFLLSTEEIFYCVADTIDTIREKEGTHECEIYIDSLYRELYNSTQRHLAAAAIVYAASAMLAISLQHCAIQYAMRLQMSIDDPDFSNTRLLYEYTQEAIKAHMGNSDRQVWKQYYLSDDYLSEQIAEEIQRVRNFDYIRMDRLEEYGLISYESFIEEFRYAAENDAPTLARFMRKYEQLGILNFHGDNKKIIFTKLQAYFPTMKQYGYKNFAAAY